MAVRASTKPSNEPILEKQWENVWCLSCRTTSTVVWGLYGFIDEVFSAANVSGEY